MIDYIERWVDPDAIYALANSDHVLCHYLHEALHRAGYSYDPSQKIYKRLRVHRPDLDEVVQTRDYTSYYNQPPTHADAEMQALAEQARNQS